MDWKWQIWLDQPQTMAGPSTWSGLGERYQKFLLAPVCAYARWKTQGISQPSWQRRAVTDPTIPGFLRFVSVIVRGRWDSECGCDGRGNSV